MTGKGIDEGCIAGMWCEVGLVITKKDLAKCGYNFITCSKLGNGKGLREARRIVEGGTNAIAGVEDGAMYQVEGEVTGVDLVEGGLGGGCVMGGERCEVGDGGGV